MDWSKLKNIPKFTPMEQVFEILGRPQFKLPKRPVYYMRTGFLIGYTKKQFRVEGINSVQYGELGEFALNIYYFQNKSEFELHFKLNQVEYAFDDVAFGNNFEIIPEIHMGSSYEQIISLKRLRGISYQEGETRTLINGAFIHLNKYIQLDNLTLFFFGKSATTKLSAFQYSLITIQ